MELGTSDKTNISPTFILQLGYTTGIRKCSLPSAHTSPWLNTGRQQGRLLYDGIVFNGHPRCISRNFFIMTISACTIFSSIKLARSLHWAYGAQNVLRMATGLLTAICTVCGIVCLLKKSICYLTGNEGYDVCMQKAIYYMILECRKQRETEERDFVRNRAYLV